MNRRELIKMIAVVTGGTVIGGEALLSGCSSKKGGKLEFTNDHIAFLDEVADTILPATTTPGARQAGVGRFMTIMVNDCYEQKDQEIFHKGMEQLEEACEDKFGSAFLDSTPPQRLELLKELDAEAKAFHSSKGKEDSNHYFTLMKQLTLFGYFTSEIGMTEARNYQPIPGKYVGCVDYKKGDKALVALDG